MKSTNRIWIVMPSMDSQISPYPCDNNWRIRWHPHRATCDVASFGFYGQNPKFIRSTVIVVLTKSKGSPTQSPPVLYIWCRYSRWMTMLLSLLFGMEQKHGKIVHASHYYTPKPHCCACTPASFRGQICSERSEYHESYWVAAKKHETKCFDLEFPGTKKGIGGRKEPRSSFFVFRYCRLWDCCCQTNDLRPKWKHMHQR